MYGMVIVKMISDTGRLTNMYGKILALLKPYIERKDRTTFLAERLEQLYLDEFEAKISESSYNFHDMGYHEGYDDGFADGYGEGDKDT